MENFLTNLGQHTGSLLNLMTMKRIDTGDRMLDTALQMIISTLTSAVISALISLYTKRLWAEVANWFLVRCGRAAHNPLKFDPLMAPDKPLNGSIFMYRADVAPGRYRYVLSWFYINHADKKYTQKLLYNLKVPCMEGMSDLMDEHHYNSAGSGDSSIPANVYLPVWRSQAGEFVYLSCVGSRSFDTGGCCFLSDSMHALRECVEHVEVHEVAMDEHMKQKNAGKKEQPYMYEVNLKGDTDVGKPINTRKTFDTLFFTQKERVVQLLSSFKEGKLFPAHLPVDHKLGFLLYGPPGTGKTGFIAAMANYLERDIVSMDMSRIQTRKQLDELLRRDPKRFMFVFEEFDCMPGVTKREETAAAAPEQPQGPMPPNAYAMMLMSEKQHSNELMEEYRRDMEAAKDKIDLGYLLRKLDGLESGEGRIIIATTNHPERIDPALLRPGRFGMQVHLTRCTRAMLADIVCMIYQVSDEQKVAELVKSLNSVEDFKWSPAEVLQLGVTLPSVTDMITHLKMSSPASKE